MDASLTLLTASIATAIFSKKHKVIKTLLVLSALLLPMLYSFEVIINASYLNPPVYWFSTYALPISAIWLVIAWATVLLYTYTPIGLWNSIGVNLLLVIPGSSLTNAIANQVSIATLYKDYLAWIDLAAYFGCALLCFVIGFVLKKRKK